jgi:hypothetical protein
VNIVCKKARQWKQTDFNYQKKKKEKQREDSH